MLRQLPSEHSFHSFHVDGEDQYMTGNWITIDAELSQPAASPPSGRTSHLTRSTPGHEIDALGANLLSVALIIPDEQRRMAVANALANSQAGLTREYSSYPELDEVPRLMQQNHDVVIVDLDSNPEYALDLVESICCHGAGSEEHTSELQSLRH